MATYGTGFRGIYTHSKVTFDWSVKTRGAGPYARLLRNIEKLAAAEEGKLASAARTATEASRTTFSSKRSGRPFVPPRTGRRTTQGRFENHLAWLDFPGPMSIVLFDEDEIETIAPYYLINEIGTGNSGRRLEHRGMEPDGSPRISQKMLTMPSQKGRHIKPGLVWADGQSAVRPQSSRYGQDQIRPAAQVSTRQVTSQRRRRRRGAVNPLRTPRVRISREIEPKHYIREGAKAGYGEYSQAIRSAARNAFERRKKARPRTEAS